MSRLDAELQVLFGRSVLMQAQKGAIDLMAVDVDLLADTALELRQAKGEPLRQRAIVDALDADTALALCMWIRDSAIGRRIIARVNQ